MPWCTVNSKKKCGNTAHCSTELDVRIRNICYTTHYRESLRFGEHSKVLERSVLCSHCRSSWFYWFCAVFNTLYKNWDISVDCRDVICWHFILAIVRDFDVNVKPLGLIFRINLQAQIKKKKKKNLANQVISSMSRYTLSTERKEFQHETAHNKVLLLYSIRITILRFSRDIPVAFLNFFVSSSSMILDRRQTSLRL